MNGEELEQLRAKVAQLQGDLAQRTAELERLRRPLPHLLEAEEAVIGCVLFSGRTFVEVGEILDAEDFYHPALRAIFEAMIEIDRQSKPGEAPMPIDILTVAEQMRQAETIGKLRAYNGEAYLAELANRVATTENVTYHACIVRDKATLRLLIQTVHDLLVGTYHPGADADVCLEDALQRVFEIAMRSRRQQTMRPGREVLRRVVQTLERRYGRKEAITGVPSGFTKFDEMTGGLQPGELVVLGGRPSMGKTSLAMNIVVRVIRRQIPTLVFSLEMTSEAVMERVLAAEARVASERLRSGLLETRDWINLTKAVEPLSQTPLCLDDSGSPTLMEIRAKCRRWRSDRNLFKPGAELGLVVIDFLQLIQGRPQGRNGTREQEVSEISRGLKALAKELRVPVLALASLNRSLESRVDKRPMPSDLRESGAIESDADLICFVYRDEVYNRDTQDGGIAELIIGKQRSGPIGTVRLAFLKEFTRFENLDEAHQP